MGEKEKNKDRKEEKEKEVWRPDGPKEEKKRTAETFSRKDGKPL